MTFMYIFAHALILRPKERGIQPLEIKFGIVSSGIPNNTTLYPATELINQPLIGIVNINIYKRECPRLAIVFHGFGKDVKWGCLRSFISKRNITSHNTSHPHVLCKVYIFMRLVSSFDSPVIYNPTINKHIIKIPTV